MRTARLVIGIAIALVAAMPRAGETTELCFPASFSARVETFDPELVDVFRSDIYVDVRAQKERIDILDEPQPGRRFYFDYAAHHWYEFDGNLNRCTKSALPATARLTQFCVPMSAQRVAVEEFAGRRIERWCADLDGRHCGYTIYTETVGVTRQPFMINSFDAPGHATFTVYTNVTAPRTGLRCEVFELPPACAALP